MKVLFIINNLEGGGAQKLITDIATNIKCQCDLLLLSNSNDKYGDIFKRNGIVVHVVPSSLNTHFQIMQFIWKIIKEGKYDLVHANLFPTIYYTSLIKRMHPKKCPPIIMTEHSTDNRRRHIVLLRPLEQLIYNSYNSVICISEQTKQYLLEWLNRSQIDKKYIVIENGIDIETYKTAIPYNKNDLFSGIGSKDVLLGLIGSFTPQKNQRIMIEVMKRLPKTYKLVFVGEGYLKEEIESLVNRNDLINRVAFLGFREDVPRIMKSLDVLCVPSNWEGFGLVAVEAMAAGTSIVASNVPGLSEIVDGCGLQCPSDDPNSFSDAILNITKGDIKESLIRTGLIKVERYSISRTCEEYLTLFQSAIT